MNKNHPLPDITLERYVLGELPADELQRIDKVIQQETAPQKKVEAIRASNAEILSQYPPLQMAREITLKAHTRKVQDNLENRSEKPSFWAMITVKPAFGAALTLLLLVGFSPVIISNLRNISSNEHTRIKGLTPHLTVYRRTKDSSEQLGNLDIVNAGDIIQVGYVASDQKYGVIISLDGKGVVTLHYPASDTAGTQLETGGEILLETAYELDDAPRFEHFFFITAVKPVSIKTVYKAGNELVKNLKTGEKDTLLDLPEEWHQHSLVLLKGKS